MARNWQRHRGYCAWIPAVSQNQKSFPSFTTASLVLAHHSVVTLTPRLRHSPFQPLPCRSRCSLQVARSVWSNEDNNRRSNLQCLPAQIVSDNGPPFQSVEYSEFLQQNGIQRILVSSYHPSSNGLAERFVQTFKYALESSVADPAWSCLILPALRNSRLQDFSYRTEAHPMPLQGHHLPSSSWDATFALVFPWLVLTLLVVWPASKAKWSLIMTSMPSSKT